MTIDAKSFIKKLTSVPESFIDEIFELYNASTTQSNFIIKLDAISKWLQTTKKSMVRTLVQSYKLGFDYIINKISPSNKKDNRNNNYREYLLTPDCFKRLAMMSKSKNAEMVRTYFIEVENLFIKYREQTLSGLEKQILDLERNQRPKHLLKQSKKGVIYIIRASDKQTLYKIGRTKNIAARLSNYGTGLADDVDVLYLYETDDIVKVENCVKLWLQEHRYRKYKEVYDVDIDTIKQIIQNCGKIGAILKYKKPGKSTMNGGYFVVINHSD